MRRSGKGTNETFAVGLLRGMVEIPSPSYGEAMLAEFLVDAMTDVGFAAHIDGTGNVVGELCRGPGPTVMLLGHLDTVPGLVPVRSESGRLYGRGTVDAKGPLAAMICAAYETVDFRGRLVVIGAVEEETPGSRGAMAIRRTHRPPDALVIGEPSGWSSIVLGYKGKTDFRYRVDRPPVHPTHPEPKAGELAVHCWTTLVELLGQDATHTRFDVPGATLCSVSGDLVSAEVEFSVRSPPGFDAEELASRLRSRLAHGELTVVGSVPACRVNRRDPVVRALSSGIREQRGRPTVKVKTATSDMNTFAELWSTVPMATYGPGDSRLDHTDDEHINLTDYIRAIAVLRTAIEELTVLGSPSAPLHLVDTAASEPTS